MISGAALTTFNLQTFNLQPSTYFSPLAPDLVVTLDFNQLRELLAAIAQTDIAELTLKSPYFELTVRKGIPMMPAIDPTVASTSPVMPSGFVAVPPPPAAMPS